MKGGGASHFGSREGRGKDRIKQISPRKEGPCQEGGPASSRKKKIERGKKDAQLGTREGGLPRRFFKRKASMKGLMPATKKKAESNSGTREIEKRKKGKLFLGKMSPSAGGGL